MTGGLLRIPARALPGDLPGAADGGGARLDALAPLLHALADAGPAGLARDRLGGGDDDGAEPRVQHFSDLPHENQLHLLADVRRDVDELLFVSDRPDDHANAGPAR